MTQTQSFRARLDDIKQAISDRPVVRDTLQPKLEALQTKLSELEAANAERWELLKTGVEVALDDLEQTYQAIKQVKTTDHRGPKSASM